MNLQRLILNILVLICLHAAFSPTAKAAEFFPNTAPSLSLEEIRTLERLDPDQPLLGASNSQIIIDDMMFDRSKLLQSGFSGKKWTDATFYYAFAPDISTSNQVRFKAGCKVWEDVSAVKCIERTDQTNYTYIKNSRYNRSYVGMQGGRQTLEIYNWGWKFIIAHEIGHALGLSHEQSRSDRDSYVKIHFDNIRSNAVRNFSIRNTLNHTPYDFRSVMHYGKNAFSINGGPTITPLPAYSHMGQYLGNRTYLSSGDAAGMAAHYGPYNKQG